MVCWVFIFLFLAAEDISGSGGSGSGSPGNGTEGLSTGAIIGIAVGGGVLAFLLLLVVAGAFVYW